VVTEMVLKNAGGIQGKVPGVVLGFVCFVQFSCLGLSARAIVASAKPNLRSPSSNQKLPLHYTGLTASRALTHEHPNGTLAQSPVTNDVSQSSPMTDDITQSH